MKIINTLKSSLILGALVIGLTTLDATERQGHIEIKSSINVLTTVIKNGVKVNKLIPATKILPNTLLYYTNTFTNISAIPADNIKLVNPIPKHTLYQTGSARGKNTDITFSINGGKSWAKPEALTVLDKEGNATAATAKDYTHIRWIYMQNLAPSEQQNVSFQARLL
jgi:uncharacterized repeat protein (TIGR01451 family)